LSKHIKKDTLKEIEDSISLVNNNLLNVLSLNESTDLAYNAQNSINMAYKFWSQHNVEKMSQIFKTEKAFTLENNLIESLSTFFNNTVELNLFLTGLIIKLLTTLLAYNKLEKVKRKKRNTIIAYELFLNALTKTNELLTNTKDNSLFDNINENEIKLGMASVGINLTSETQNYVVLKEFTKELVAIAEYIKNNN